MKQSRIVESLYNRYSLNESCDKKSKKKLRESSGSSKHIAQVSFDIVIPDDEDSLELLDTIANEIENIGIPVIGSDIISMDDAYDDMASDVKALYGLSESYRGKNFLRI